MQQVSEKKGDPSLLCDNRWQLAKKQIDINMLYCLKNDTMIEFYGCDFALQLVSAFKMLTNLSDF